MNKLASSVLLAAVVAVAGVATWRLTEPSPPAQAAGGQPGSAAHFLDLLPIKPLPEGMALDARKVTLGERLFHEKRLSSDGTISCASCHDLSQGGDDGRRVSVGVGGAEGQVNAPTVLNCGFNFRQFWDGRAASLEEQVDGPLQHPAEMGNSWERVLSMLQADSTYAATFRDIYAGGISQENLRDAIATFERSLVTPNSRFDRWLRGEADVLTAEEKDGFQLFVSVGCITCHQGVNVGGNMFQVMGRLGDYFKDHGGAEGADLGRFNVTGDAADLHKFKVPSLRNVALTAPYLHDGSAATLQEAVQVMARYQMGRELEDREARRIVAFLETLTGESAVRP